MNDQKRERRDDNARLICDDLVYCSHFYYNPSMDSCPSDINIRIHGEEEEASVSEKRFKSEHLICSYKQ